MSKRKSFFADADNPEADQARVRNLEALIAPRQAVTQDIPLDRILPNPFQARRHFDNLEELAEAMRQQGFISRLRVRPAPDEDGVFQLVFGERRLRAARLAGLATVPCDIAQHSDEELIEIGLAENIQRRDLAPLEEAQAFRLFIDQRGYSIRKLAERIGKDKSYVEDRLKLLSVPPDVQAMVQQREDTVQVAREIAKLTKPEEREPLITGVVSGVMTKADVRQAVREAQGGSMVIQEPKQGEGTDERTATLAVTRGVLKAIDKDGLKIRDILDRWRQQAVEREARAAIRVNLEELIYEFNVLLRETALSPAKDEE